VFEGDASLRTIGPAVPGGAGSPGPPGAPPPEGVGLFASALVERFPLLPVEDEEGLRDVTRRDAFVERVYSYSRSRLSRSHA